MSKNNRGFTPPAKVQVQELPIIKEVDSEFVQWSKKQIKAIILAGILAKIGNTELARIESKKIAQEIIDGKD